MLTIKGFDHEENKSVLCGLACILYEDEKSLYYAIKYLVDFFNFKPEIIVTDFSLSLNKALQNKNLFEKLPILIKCIFIFHKHYKKKLKV